MRGHAGISEHPENGEKIDLSTTMSGAPAVEYKGRIVVWDWQELIQEAVEMIDENTEH
ncbi:hypothetical protein NHG32_02490 [Aerococcaceae bacterium NML191219]|nr:hypothetical protein [Aerococcaceae bacterium NML191219]